MNHDDIYIEHEHTPVRAASHKYKRCLEEKNNKEECEMEAIQTYESYDRNKELFDNCMENAFTDKEEEKCNKDFNKEGLYKKEVSLWEFDDNKKKIKCMDEYVKQLNVSDEEKKKVEECINQSKNNDSKFNLEEGKCLENDYYRQGKVECNKEIQKKKNIFNFDNFIPEINFLQLLKKFLKYIFKILNPFYLLFLLFSVFAFLFLGSLLLIIIVKIIVFMLSFFRFYIQPVSVIINVLNMTISLPKKCLVLNAKIFMALFVACFIFYCIKKIVDAIPFPAGPVAREICKKIGIFPSNSKIVFNFFDNALLKCHQKMKPELCYPHSFWVFIENWLVRTIKDVYFPYDDNMSEYAIRKKINFLRDNDISENEKFNKLFFQDIIKSKMDKFVKEGFENEKEKQIKPNLPKPKKPIIEEYLDFGNLDFSGFIEKNINLKELQGLQNNFDNIKSDFGMNLSNINSEFKDIKNIQQ
jgi:hypothetical protein